MVNIKQNHFLTEGNTDNLALSDMKFLKTMPRYRYRTTF